jgi:hypothetical protein
VPASAVKPHVLFSDKHATDSNNISASPWWGKVRWWVAIRLFPFANGTARRWVSQVYSADDLGALQVIIDA